MIGAKNKNGIEIIKRRENEERSEILFQITLNGARRFGIYILDCGVDAMALFDAEIAEADDLFDRVSSENLSAIYLEEVISDFSKEKIL